MNSQEFLKEVRATARSMGMTLKEDTRITINNNKAYKIIDRKTKDVLVSNCTLDSAYQNLLSGYAEEQR